MTKIEIKEDPYSYDGIVIEGNNKKIRFVTYESEFANRHEAIKKLKEILHE